MKIETHTLLSGHPQDLAREVDEFVNCQEYGNIESLLSIGYSSYGKEPYISHTAYVTYKTNRR